jgi:wobble nucleotide-excising tRNase
MKTLKHMMILIILMSLVIALSGCGVNEDENQAVVSELNETKDQLDKANDRIAQLEKSLKAAQAQGKIGIVDTVQEAAELRAKIESLTNENSNLKSMLDKLTTQLSELQGKFKELQNPAGNMGFDLLK